MIFFQEKKEFVRLENKKNFSILRLEGEIDKKQVSYSAIEEVLAGKEIENLLIWINSWGGDVYETHAIVEYIDSLKGNKVTFIPDFACSAGYRIALCGDKLYASPAALVGSIGVYSIHTDFSEALKKEGIKITEICDPDGKLAHSPYHEISEQTLDSMENSVKKEAASFYQFVSERRQLTVENIKAFNAQVFNARDALKERLIDEIINTSDVYVNIFKEKTKSDIEMTDNSESFRMALDASNSALDVTKAELNKEKLALQAANLELANLKAENNAYKTEFISRYCSLNKQLHGTNEATTENYDALSANALIQATRMLENLVKNKIENNMPMTAANTSRNSYENYLVNALRANAQKNGGFY